MQVISGVANVFQRGVHVSGGEHTSSANEVTFSVADATAVIRTPHPVILETGDRITIAGETDKRGLFKAFAIRNHTRGVTTGCTSSTYMIVGVIFIIIGIPFSIVGVGLIFVGLGIWFIMHNNRMAKALKVVSSEQAPAAAA